MNYFFYRKRPISRSFGSMIYSIIRTMKITLVLIFAFCVAVKADSKAQNITLSVKNVTLEELFTEISKRTDYRFLYDEDLLKTAPRVTLDLKNKSIEAVMDQVTVNLPLEYKIISGTVVINESKPKRLIPTVSPQKQNDIVLSGKVQDTNGEVLSGATVSVKNNSAKSVTTDAEGMFSIEVEEDDVLVITYIGFETQEVSVNGKDQLVVVMEMAVGELNEVVVTGYSSQRRKDIIGSVAVVDMEAMKSVPSGSSVQALQGQAAGVNIIRSGAPGGSSNVFIRGISSFGNTQPLVLVDGVEGNLDNINANDIESMQVLKDAGAAAIYGVRGSNGVIIVTTKKGKVGVPVITYDSYYGIQQPLQGNVFDLLGSEDFARLTMEVNPHSALFQNGLPDFLYRGPEGSGVGMRGDPEVDPSRYNLDLSNSSNNYLIQEVNKVGTDWFHELFKSAHRQNHNLTVSGGTDKSTYLVSMAYLDEKGTMIETFLKRYSLRVNTSYHVKDNIRIGQNAYAFYKQNKSMDGVPISWTYRSMPIIPVYDIMGNYGGTFTGPELGASSNAIAVQRNTVNDRFNTWNLIGNVYAEVDFLKHITARTSIGGTLQNLYNTNFSFTPYNNTEGNNNPNSFSEGAGYSTSLTWTNTLTYKNTFKEHDVNVIIGSEAISDMGRNVGGARQGFFSTNMDYLILDNGTSNVTNYSNASVNTLFSLFGRVDYSFLDRYLLGVTVRRDGSSRFGSEKRYGVFPSFSAGWRVSEESFMQGLDWLDDLKLRGSYGILGSQNNVTPENAFSLYGGGFGNAYYDITGSTNSVEQGFYQTRIGNPRTSWEQDIISNIGYDITLLNNRVDLSMEWYRKSIKGLLFPQPLPATVGGATSPTVNIGDIRNTGWDISARYNGRISEDLQFTLGTNITTYKNVVVEIPGPGYFDAASTQVLGNVVRNQEGYPVSSFFGYDIIGLFNDIDDVNASPTQTDAAPGRFKYRDVDGDGEITPDDRTFIGNPNPDFTYGLNLGVAYKGFDFSAILYGSQGNEVHNQILNYTNFFSTYAGGKSNVLLNAWTPENTNTKVPKIESQGSFSSSGVANSYYIEDGSYLRLSSLIIGYTINPSILQKYGLNRLRIYGQAANLFTITNYSGLDPELSGNSSAFGVDYANYPNSQRSFLLGLNVSF